MSNQLQINQAVSAVFEAANGSLWARLLSHSVNAVEWLTATKERTGTAAAEPMRPADLSGLSRSVEEAPASHLFLLNMKIGR